MRTLYMIREPRTGRFVEHAGRLSKARAPLVERGIPRLFETEAGARRAAMHWIACADDDVELEAIAVRIVPQPQHEEEVLRIEVKQRAGRPVLHRLDPGDVDSFLACFRATAGPRDLLCEEILAEYDHGVSVTVTWMDEDGVTFKHTRQRV